MKLKAVLALLAAICLVTQGMEASAQTTVPREKIPSNVRGNVKKEIEALYLSDLNKRTDAVKRLGKMGEKAAPAIPFLIGLLHHGWPERMTITSSDTVGGRTFTTSITVLIVEAKVASNALAKIGKPAIEPLAAALKHENAQVRSYAARALGTMHEMDAVKALMTSLRSESAEVRTAASSGLSESKDSRVVEPLLASLQDQSPTVREEAVATLEAISGEKFGQDQAKWQEWWDKEKAKKAE